MMDDCSTSCAFAIYLLFIFSQIAWFHAQVDTAHLIDLDYLYSNFIADVDNILYLRYALVRKLGNMNHTILVRSQLYECTEIHDADNGTCQNLTRLDVGHDALDDGNCLVDHCLIGAAYRYAAIVLDIDLNAGLLDDLVDYLALLADYIADLLRIDGDLNDLRSILADGLSRLGDNRRHNFIQNVESCLSRLSDCLLDDRAGQTVDLDIHLDGSDTLVSAAYLEVHIAEEVFQTLDIGQNDVIIIGVACYQTAGNTSYRSS